MGRWSIARRCSVVVALAAGACGPAEPGSRDAGIDADDEEDADRLARPAAPALPVGPELPTLAPCPPGWAEQPVDGAEEIVLCHPWPAGSPADCGDDEVQWPGTAACEPIGTACPEGGWPEGLPDGGVAYVRPGGGAAGEGSRQRPYRSIRRAVGSGATTVALSEGVFHEAVTLPAGVTLVGACAGGTWLSAHVAVSAPTLRLTGDGAGARDVGVSGGERGIEVSPGATARLDGILVSGVAGPAVQVRPGGRLEGRRLVVRGLPASLATVGVFVEEGGRAALQQVEVAYVAGMGLRVRGGQLVGRSVTVRDLEVVAVGGLGYFGEGVRVEAGGAADLRELVVDRARRYAIRVGDVGSAVELRDAVVRDTAVAPTDAPPSANISVAWGATARLVRTFVDGGIDPVIGIAGEGTTGSLEDVVTRWTSGNPYWLQDAPIQIVGRASDDATQDGPAAQADLRRIAVLESEGGGVTASLGAEVRAEDVFVRAANRAVLADSGAHIELDRLRAERCAFGLSAIQREATLVARDVAIVDGEGFGGSAGGYGMTIGMTARASVERVLLENNSYFGVDVYARGVLEAADLTVRGTRPLQGVGFGYGVIVDSAEGRFVRSEIADNHGLGVLSSGIDARAVFEDLVVRGTRANTDCTVSPEGCVQAPGIGFGAYQAHAEATRFEIADNELCGVQVAEAAGIDLHDGEVSGHPIGASIMAPGFDLSRLEDGVRWRDNERPLDTREMPIPPLPDLD